MRHFRVGGTPFVGLCLLALLGATAVAEEAAPAADLSGITFPNSATPFPNIVTGGQVDDAALQAAKEKGVKMVINLRPDDEPEVDPEEKRKVEALGMTYILIPVAGLPGVTVENAKALAAALTDTSMPALVHCKSGNRVGALFALKAFHVDGKSAEEALEIGRKAGITKPGLEEHVKGLLVQAP